MSIRRIIQTLRPIQHISVRIAGHVYDDADPLSPTAATIPDALQISPHDTSRRHEPGQKVVDTGAFFS